MTDFSMKKLGKAPPKFLKGLPHFNHYTGALPPAPEKVTNSAVANTNFGEMLNDQLSCCTCSAAGHAGQIWTANSAGHEFTATDAEIELMYEGSCGYNPGNSAATDQGGIETNVLTYWLKNPLGATITLDAFASITPGDHATVKDAIWLLGGVYIGLALPLSAQHQAVWDVTPDSSQNWFDHWFAHSGMARSNPGGDPTPGSWGGHAVYVCDYSPRGLVCITWGKLQLMTWPFWDKYCDEAYGLLSKSWIKSTGLSPAGFKFDELEADIGLLRT